MLKEALLYEALAGGRVRCQLCCHRCLIPEQGFGICGVRQNLSGRLYTHAYGQVVAAHVDPVEKKPFYHLLPGSSSFSVATIGCNFRCGFCQNWQISQASFVNGDRPSQEELEPKEIVQQALSAGCRSISYTYTEPTIFFEYAFQTARLARENGLFNNFVTNGYMTRECLKCLHPYLDAANVDLKFFSEDSYRKKCAASLGPVLDSIRLMKDSGVWVEVTTLVIPSENDSEEELCGIAQFIAGVDKDMPWHVSAFHPDYRYSDHKATPLAALRRAVEYGRQAGLTYVYAGNIAGLASDTICPSCRKTLVRREGFSVLEKHLEGGLCVFCGARIAGIW